MYPDESRVLVVMVGAGCDYQWPRLDQLSDGRVDLRLPRHRRREAKQCLVAGGHREDTNLRSTRAVHVRQSHVRTLNTSSLHAVNDSLLMCAQNDKNE